MFLFLERGLCGLRPVPEIGQGGLFDEAMYAPVGGLAITRSGPQSTSAFDVARPQARFIYHWHRLPPKSKHSSSASKAEKG